MRQYYLSLRLTAKFAAHEPDPAPLQISLPTIGASA